MQVLVKNWLVDAEKTEVAHLWAAVNVWLKYQSCLVEPLHIPVGFKRLHRLIYFKF